MSYFYGPVLSRRLGYSLGVDPLPEKYCTFNCIYCQSGLTKKKTLRRISYVDMKKFSQELTAIIAARPKLDCITIAGCGEPTLHKNLDKIILLIKRITRNRYPVCVITNASLLYRKDVRRELQGADIIIPSLDTVSPSIFKKINAPIAGLTLSHIIASLVKLRQEYWGKLWLEIMLVKRINDSLKEARRLRTVISLIHPDRIQLNLPTRPSIGQAAIPSTRTLAQFKKILGSCVDVVGHRSQKKQPHTRTAAVKQIIEFIRRRPATANDLICSLGLSSSRLHKILRLLTRQGHVKKEGGYFTLDG